jgi:peroxiredoxin
MNGLLLAIRVLLALVLAVAGAGKLADRSGARQAVTGFGVPEPLARPVANLLPLVELATAILLIPSVTQPVGAALALALMLAFSAAIARSIARGETPECHCFGALHSEPAGPRTLVRNLLLSTGAAAALVGGPGTSATRWLAGLSGGWLAALLLGIALAATVAAAGSLALRLLRRNGQLLLRVDALEGALAAGGVPVPSDVLATSITGGLAIGTEAPEFELDTLARGRTSLASLRAGTAELMLVFTDPGCGPCTALMPQLAEWQRDQPGGLRTVLISRGDREANLAHAREHGLSDVLLQDDREVSQAFRVDATPSAVLISAAGTVTSVPHAGEDQIRALVASRSEVALEVHRHVPVLSGPAPDLGPAPDRTLRTLEGQPVQLSSMLTGSARLIVFWNPTCGFCERMIEQLQAIDASLAAGATGLVVISTGDPEANRALGLQAPILLDDSFAAGQAFGAAGTPSAVMVDEQGRVGSAVAVGADAVLALAGAERVAIAA